MIDPIDTAAAKGPAIQPDGLDVLEQAIVLAIRDAVRSRRVAGSVAGTITGPHAKSPGLEARESIR
jgi:hypothetical protein